MDKNSFDQKERAAVFPKEWFSPSKGRKKTLSSSNQGSWVSHEFSLEKIIKNKPIFEAFKDFLSRNFSEENLLLWLDIEKFRASKFSSQSELKKEANKLYKKYQNVHLSSEMRSQIGNNLENPTQDVFKELQEEMMHVLQTDSIPKFFRSDIYQSLRPQEEKEIEFVASKAVLLLKSFRSFLEQNKKDKAKAEEMENRLQRMGSEFAQLYKEKTILKSTLISEFKEPVHKLCDVIIDGYEIPFSFSAKGFQDALKVVQDQIHKILGKELSGSTLKEMDALFEFMNDEEMIYDFFEKKKYTETKEVGIVLREMWDANII